MRPKDTSYHRQSDGSASHHVTGRKDLVRIDFQHGSLGGGPQAMAGTGGGRTTSDPTANDVAVVP
jgi:hypothetical protein